MQKIKVEFVETSVPASRGSAGLRTQLPGACITADAIGADLGNKGSLSQIAIEKETNK